MLMMLVISCGHKLSPEQQQQLSELKQQLQAVRAEVADARKQHADYSGGLLKTLIEVRLELLKTNEALIDQRVQALESGAKMTIAVPITKDDPIRAAQLASELEAQKQKLSEANAKAARYSGGLIQAMSLVSAATISNTVAMLEQQHLAAKYGLALAIPSTAVETKDK